MNGEWNPSSLAQDSGHGNAQNVRRVTAYDIDVNPAGVDCGEAAGRANWTIQRQFTHREGTPRMTRLLLSLLLLAVHERSVGELADGVYVTKHRDAPDTNPQGNTTVIIGDRDVMVIDSGHLPSSTREDIAQIREWTKKPVRYSVNTHWHPDHIRGNSLYADAFPGLAIAAHTVTPELEEEMDAPIRARYCGRVAVLEDQLTRGKGADGKKLRDEERKAMNEELAGRREVLQEFATYAPVHPSATFSNAMTIDLGGRDVHLRFYGRGHSSGDIVAYLPHERVLVAGDLAAWPVPYFIAGYPYDEIATLESLATLDALAIVPRHGDVMLGESYLDRTIEVMMDVRDQVVRETRRLGPLSAKLEDVRQGVNCKTYAAEFAGTDKENLEFFAESREGLVKTLFEQIPKWRAPTRGRPLRCPRLQLLRAEVQRSRHIAREDLNRPVAGDADGRSERAVLLQTLRVDSRSRVVLQ